LKKSGIINPLLLYHLAMLGHKDIIVIADAGLPIPSNVTRIDLAFVPNIPRFLDVLKAVLEEIVVEKAVLAEEIKIYSPQILQAVIKLLKQLQELSPEKDVIYVKHTVFKEAYVKNAKVVIRTGEYTPYANIALISGVPF
jgi:D-ribose pyranase